MICGEGNVDWGELSHRLNRQERLTEGHQEGQAQAHQGRAGGEGGSQKRACCRGATRCGRLSQLCGEAGGENVTRRGRCVGCHKFSLTPPGRASIQSACLFACSLGIPAEGIALRDRGRLAEFAPIGRGEPAMVVKREIGRHFAHRIAVAG
ncbi:MAG: hypothetical protein ACK56F_09030, partial [bacterium]